MTGWTEGYVADIPYSLGFYRETVPTHIGFAALSVGKHSGLSMRPRRVLELGIGMGLGFVINAAANPKTTFEGVDFNPLHIAHAQGLVDLAEIGNAHLREASFQDIAREATEGQHDLDLIVLHGILTWVSADAHVAIVDIARKRLKPGGLLYVSYNAMPGWAPVVPMQRLMRENAKRIGGRSDVQTGSGLTLVKSLIDEGALYFAANGNLKGRVDKLLTMDRNYLAHEYLNANWFIFHFADVAEMFSRAKLDFIGSATLAENIDVVGVPESARTRIASESDPVFKETLRDFASNKQFRRDLFGRGVSATTAAEQNALLATMRFALAVPRSKVTFKIAGPIGEISGNEEMYGGIADRLAEGPASLVEIAQLPVFKSNGATALQALSLYVHSGQVLPLSTECDIDCAPAQRLNRVLASKLAHSRTYNFLAAPIAGSGVPVSNVELLMLDEVMRMDTIEVGKLGKRLDEQMMALGLSWLRDGQAITDLSERAGRSENEATSFVAEKLSIWQHLGVL